ncbi:type VI secretion system contractile sheath large subunit [Limnoglobus roseus]|uniref:Type VI secretion system contractile sheath large subunit n=1 Tax=Limnoglobus roseus TaxID=2598579 RepID=A0A5C1AQI9_9BACT|nr:type VI secretion system contractile sheath large subunit [Limnoglobus roseus]QEL19454.1 type VI secretion system contractile sheath large subunit [Limnoglobus roseus]
MNESPLQSQTTTETDYELSLIDQVIAATKPQDTSEASRAKDYLKQFLDQVVQPGAVVSKDVETNIKTWIGEVDKKLSAQVNKIMHTPEFQKLESTWRGLHYLVNQSETGESLKIRVLNVTKREVLKDLEKAAEFDQSTLFKRLYEEEYGQLGGNPYGMIVGDYEFGRGAEDVSLLKMMSQVAAAAHAPFVAGTSPKMFGLDNWTDLPKPRDLAKVFDSVDYAPWKSFRESPDSRYVALTMPRVLARLPYGEEYKKVDAFNFEEDVDGTDHAKYNWMNAAWAYAARITDSFSKYGWMARTRGVEAGGKVEGLPVHTFPTDDGDIAMKCPTEIAITDRREYELSQLGFLPLLHHKDRDFAVFMGAQSCQKPQQYMDPAANSNAELSAKFNLLLCTSRFAHYLKVMARDKIGSFMDAGSCAAWLNDWIRNFVVDPAGASEDTLANRPLSEARVDVQPVAGKPGWFEAVAYLKPHYQFEGISTSMRLVAEVPKKG